jgi:hypothetical protein
MRRNYSIRHYAVLYERVRLEVKFRLWQFLLEGRKFLYRRGISGIFTLSLHLPL